MSVRPFAEADIPRVVDLYWRFMRRRGGTPPAELHPLFHQLYFENPWVDSAYPSLVYEGKNGEVVGFLGIIARKMSLCGRPFRVGYGGNFIVDPGARATLAAQRLLGSYLGGKYELWQTDSANDISRTLLERLGFRTIPALNLHWIRALRPAQYASYALSRALSSAPINGLRFIAKPFCVVSDLVATKLSASPFYPSRSRLHGSELDIETLQQCLVDFRDGYSIWAEYDIRALRWLMTFMSRDTVRGQLRKIVLRDDKDQIVGWYIYYVKSGAVGEVVQVGSSKRSTKDVLDHLFYDAFVQGLIGLHGIVDRERLTDFSDKGCVFTCRGGWNVVFSRNTQILDALERGDSFVTRLDGEWCLDFGV
ncbi:MAG TPA: GNAT family N-acetyltransferase [Candidatus Eisenbacteria bacterium]|nr:GNAT family N-acetyltransferase [Candidatus Eisenbacteria bacterium]